MTRLRLDDPYEEQSLGQRGLSRRALLRYSFAGVPVVVGAALMGKGGFMVADLWWREHTVDDLAAGTGRAAALHHLDTTRGASQSAGASGSRASDARVGSVGPGGEVNRAAEQDFPLPSAPDPDAVEDWAADAEVIGAVAMASIRLNAPIVDVNLITRDGEVVWEVASNAVGHHHGTAMPGERGNAVFSGHISSRGAGDVFRHLPDLVLGDPISVDLNGLHYYEVTDKLVVDPSESWVMEATDTPIATFITCVPDGVYSERLVVVAEPLT